MILEYEPLHVKLSQRSPIDCNSVEDVCRWMREYWKDHSGDHKKAFMTGFYQIAQAIEWKCNPTESNTEWASCVLHVIGACEMLGGSIQPYTPPHFSSFAQGKRDWNTLLWRSSTLCQLHTYHDEPGPRHERFTLGNLGVVTSQVVDLCLCEILPQKRVAALTRALEQLVNVEYMK